MKSFTSGEWCYVGYNKDGTHWYLIGASERAVGLIRHEEDARLVASAPEMYDELYEALQLIAGTSSYDGDEYSSQAQSIRELLARIDGAEASDEA